MNPSIDFGQILIRIWDAASIYLARPRSGVNNLQTAANRLTAKLKDVDGAIDEAERNGQTASEEARQWKREAEEFVSKEVVAAIQRDYGAMQCLGGCSWNCISINRRVTKELKVVNELISGVDVSRVAVRQPPPPVVELPVPNNVVGIELNVIEIVNQIRDENVSVIGIYGMGGIGKTTLLKIINNLHEQNSRLEFEYVVWIVASKGCKLQKLQMDLAKKVGLNLEDDDSEDDRAYKLRNFLKEKSCLLFLDDIWQSYELFMLGMEPLKHGMKQKRKVVVFTTRYEQVCIEMRANEMKKVEGLPSDQAWELFLKYAREDILNSELRINQLAKEIAKECAGVPLALITVSRAMCGKRSMEAWNDALVQLKKSKMPEVTGLGLIDNFDTISNAFDRGYSLIETLTSACLLEVVDKEYTTRIKMHDVIRDMALWLASDCGSNQHKWIVKARAGLSRLELENEQPQVVERASFMHNDLSSLPRQTPTFPKLSMLMLQQNRELDLIPGPFFQSLPVLKFLDLSGTKITVLPREINMLSELQHLNLNFTRIKALPAELSSLANLKYLLLEGTQSLIEVPKETISNLPMLKLLDLYKSKYANLDALEGFKGCRKHIGITLHSMTDLERLGSLSQLSTWKLQLSNIRDSDFPSQLFESIMSGHNTRQGLEQLEILNVTTGGELTVARSNSNHEEGLECLRYMKLQAVNDLQEITWKAVKPQMIFPNLHELNIFGCKMLRNVNWVLQLPSLSVLRVSDCGAMEELISCVGNSVNPSISLRLLSLALLPKLNCISQQLLIFPYLERIYVSSCPELRKLPFGAEICQNKLKGIFGRTDWWENIQWEDVNDKNSLTPYFKYRAEKTVLKLGTEVNEKLVDAKYRARVLKTVSAIPGAVSATLDDDHLIVIGYIETVTLVRRLRKEFGRVEIISIGPEYSSM